MRNRLVNDPAGLVAAVPAGAPSNRMSTVSDAPYPVPDRLTGAVGWPEPGLTVMAAAPEADSAGAPAEATSPITSTATVGAARSFANRPPPARWFAARSATAPVAHPCPTRAEIPPY